MTVTGSGPVTKSGATGGATAASSRRMMGTYELVRRLGVGGMGEVWLARQRGAAGFNREVAIKRLLPQAMEQPDVVQMFIEEAQITGRLRHANVANVIELGAAESGELYLVLEYVDGTGLHKLLRTAETRPSASGALAIGREVALALHAAHTLTDDDGSDLGLVHRDVTPSNVMIDRHGHVKLMDFGIAKVRAKSNQTEAGIIKGKLAYLAPEQLQGQVDTRSDLFALGLVVWETVAGTQARSAETEAMMMAKVGFDTIPSIRTVRPDLPDAVVAAVDKAVAAEPDARYQSGEEMARAMLDALDTLPERNRMESAREELAERVRTVVKTEAAAQQDPTGAGRTRDDRRIALTLHSLVVQEGGITLSRPLTADMIRSQPPPGSRLVRASTFPGAPDGSRSALLPVLMLGGAVLVAGGVFALRGLRHAPTPSSHAPVTVQHAVIVPPVVTHETPVQLPVPSLLPVADAAVATAPVVLAPHHGPHGVAPHGAHGVAVGVDPHLPGTLGVFVSPMGDVVIDGHDYGSDRFPPVSLAPGRHTVSASNSTLGTRRTEHVDLGPGQRVTLRIDLTTTSGEH